MLLQYVEELLLRVNKGENLEFFLVVLSLDIKLECKNFRPTVSELLKSIVKHANTIDFNIKCESFFKAFCEHEKAEYVTIVFHTEIGYKGTTFYFL